MNRPLVSRLSTVVEGITVDKAETNKFWVGYYTDDGDVDLNSVVHGDTMASFGRPVIENTSHQYSSPELLNLDVCHSDEKPLWWLVLRWMKMMLFKTARSYHAKPLLLMVAPLFIGILLGFLIGKGQSLYSFARPRQIQHASKNENHQQHQQERMHLLRIGRLTEFISIFWYRLGLILTFFTPRTIMSRTYEIGWTIWENSFVKMHAREVVGIKNISEVNCKMQYDDVTLGDENNNNLPTGLSVQEDEARSSLKSAEGTLRECDVPADQVPRHIAVIMDGNRRYGKSKYGSVAKGHWDGSSKLVEFAKWCKAEKISVLTVFAFSSENWKRDPSEVASLMQIFAKYCDELRVEAVERNIKIMVLSTDYEKIPTAVSVGVKRMVNETKHCDGMIMNICLSYGSRGEIVGATKLVIEDVLQGKLDQKDIDEKTLGERLLTYNCGGDPDVLIRTSGEVRISNFLLWQLAYTEFFFIDKPWPAIQKNDLLEVIRTYAKNRKRRYGT